MSIYKTFQTRPDLERDGIWLDYGFLEGDSEKPIRIKVARAGGGNQRFAQVLEAKTKPHRRSIQTETIDRKLSEQIVLETYAEAVLLDWMNVSDKDGNPLPFNKENAVLILTDLPDLFADIREQTQKVALFRETILETDAGN